MRKCSGFVGNPKEKRARLTLFLETQQTCDLSEMCASPYDTPGSSSSSDPGGSQSLSLSFIYNAQTSEEEKKQLIDLHCRERFCELDFEELTNLFASQCLQETHASSQDWRANNCRNWPQNPLKGLPGVWIMHLVVKKTLYPEGRHRWSLSNGMKVQTISSPATSWVTLLMSI